VPVNIDASVGQSDPMSTGAMRTIETDRLVLRPWEDADADFLFDLESRGEIIRYLGPRAALMTSVEQARQSIVRRRAIDHPIHGVWAIVARADGRLLGNVLLKPIPLSVGVQGAPPIEIGWHLHPDAQGAGYATEAAAAVLKDAASGGLPSVIAVTNPQNIASQRVCARLGLERRGTTASFYDETTVLFERDLEHR